MLTHSQDFTKLNKIGCSGVSGESAPNVPFDPPGYAGTEVV